jgi:WD40 repeat protein
MSDQDGLTQLVQDARRFIMYHKGAIEGYPLQIYASALLLSPPDSLIRRLFQHEELGGISIRPTVSDGWSACLQTLEGNSGSVYSVAFSHDSTQLASASSDRTVKIWDASSGACLQTLKGHSSPVISVTFSHDSIQLASASWDRTVKIWDARSGACLQTLKGHIASVTSVVFSHDSTQLASASYDSTVKIWDASSGACLQTLDVGKALNELSFDPACCYLHTEIGSIDIRSSEVSSQGNTAEPVHPLHVGTGVSSDRKWIQYAGDNMLWVPSEYRPSCSSVSGTMVGVGVGSGQVWICSIDLRRTFNVCRNIS